MKCSPSPSLLNLALRPWTSKFWSKYCQNRQYEVYHGVKLYKINAFKWNAFGWQKTGWSFLQLDNIKPREIPPKLKFLVYSVLEPSSGLSDHFTLYLPAGNLPNLGVSHYLEMMRTESHLQPTPGPVPITVLPTFGWYQFYTLVWWSKSVI